MEAGALVVELDPPVLDELAPAPSELDPVEPEESLEVDELVDDASDELAFDELAVLLEPDRLSFL